MKEKDFAAMLSVLAAALLTLAKLAVGVFTGSLGVLSEALHSTYKHFFYLLLLL